MSIFKSLFKKKESGITPEQKDLVQSTFVQVVPIAETAASIFYDKLFELNPDLKPLFKGDMKEQGQKLMTMLAAAVKGLDDMKSLVPIVQDLGKRHVNYGVSDKDYETVAEALLYTLEKGLGSSWNEEVKNSWAAVYGVLATTMKDAAKAA